MNFFETLRPALTGLFAASLVAAAADALFDDRADGVRLICGLSMAISVARAVTDVMGG